MGESQGRSLKGVGQVGADQRARIEVQEPYN